MPIYVYECRECKEETEELQKHDAAPPETCPACGRRGTLRRAMPLSNFRLKGPGWSNDGYGG